MPMLSFHVRHLVDSSDYTDIKTQVTKKNGKTIHVLWGRPKGGGGRRPLSIRYPRDSWAAADARAERSGGTFDAASE